MAQKIGFIGNCQMETLYLLYRRLIGDSGNVEAFYTPSYEPADPKRRRMIARADVIVRQILDFDQKIGQLDSSAQVHLFPHVTGAFLWPYGGQAHPLNRHFPYLDASGPYPSELGDAFLNKMIADGVKPDIAVKRYLDTDVATEKKLERLRELVLDRQRSRDRACGYNFADVIDARGQTEPLFRSPNHPEIPLTLLMATQLFTRLGMSPDLLALIETQPSEDLFPKSETPIHPSVAETFGLTFAGKDRHYCYFDEGKFTFEEYAGRYMRFTWDSDLAEGLYWFRKGESEKALAPLEKAAATSTRSALGLYILSDLLFKQLRLPDAVSRAKEAFELEPGNKHYKERYEYFKSRLPPTPPPPKEPEPMVGSRLEIEFGADGNAYKFLHEGWSRSETSYTWTLGRQASLQIGKAPVSSGYILTFIASPFTPRARPFQRCLIRLNGIAVADFRLEKAEENSVWIPSDLDSDITDRLIITFELPDAARPVDFEGEIPDHRMLGLAFQRMTLDRLGSA